MGEATTGAASVSEREAEVLGLLRARLSNAAIAGRLHISVRTVESHVSSLLRKYAVPDRAALAAIAGPAEDGTDRIDGLASAAAAGSSPAQILGLPVPRTPFIGRVSERDAILAALRTERLVTLLGPGGVGKTRLAASAAWVAGPAFPSGGAFVDLVPAGAEFVTQAVAAALGVTESGRQTLAEGIVHRFGAGRSLLVLDNCEHLVDAVAAFADRMLSGCPGLTILATSRERLAVPGERVLPVAPLPLGSHAEELFRVRAAAVDPDVVLDAAVVGEVCRRLDGMPLAIELAAARLPALGGEGLRAGLDDALRLVSGGRGAHVRHRSLRDVISWSYGLLDHEERGLFRRLAVFAGPFDLAAAAAMLPGGEASAAADLLGRLVEKSMVVRQRGARGSWRLLETVRTFAEDELRASGELNDVRARHLEWAAGTAAELDRRRVAAGSWRDDFDLVVDDLRAAVSHAWADRSRASTAARAGRGAHRLARSLAALSYARRFVSEATLHFRQAADLAPAPGAAAHDLRSAAETTLAGLNPGTEAFDLLVAAADRAGEAGEPETRARLLARAVEAACRFNADPTAVPRERLARMLADARACADPGDAVTAAALAAAAAWAGGYTWRAPDSETARLAVGAARVAGDPVLISACLDAVSAAAVRAGRLREAHLVSGERLPLVAAMARDDPAAGAEIADALHMAVTYAVAAGDLPAARPAAVRLHADELVGHHPYASAGKLVTVLALGGAFEEVLDHAEDMWEGWLRAGRPVATALAPAVLSVALVHGLRGDEDGFADWRMRARQVSGAADPAGLNEAPGVASFAAFVDARVAVHTGRLADAAEVVLRAFADYPLSRHEAYAHAAGAELAVVAELPDAAGRLAEAAIWAGQNEWAAACLARARGRAFGDAALLAESAAGWERIGAAYELRSTRELIAAT
ncbi:LuxR C-terminal-related transcriptional regulator [Actinopolymorpha sp. NPDC004070]|uniref:ATP-binding protein n=1 Tax=Actinopolymorpha sp. NPDC004070 TaxID=3154548 RepID=UPI0033A1F9C1